MGADNLFGALRLDIVGDFLLALRIAIHAVKRLAVGHGGWIEPAIQYKQMNRLGGLVVIGGGLICHDMERIMNCAGANQNLGLSLDWNCGAKIIEMSV